MHYCKTYGEVIMKVLMGSVDSNGEGRWNSTVIKLMSLFDYC